MILQLGLGHDLHGYNIDAMSSICANGMMPMSNANIISSKAIICYLFNALNWCCFYVWLTSWINLVQIHIVSLQATMDSPLIGLNHNNSLWVALEP
jgi:hypothetical protein